MSQPCKVGLWLTQLIRFNKLPKPIYQTECTKPNILNKICYLDLIQIYQTKSIDPNLPNQTYKPESTKSNLPTKMIKILRTKYTKPNLFKQTYKKINPIITIKPNTNKRNSQTVKVQFQLKLSLAQLSPSLLTIIDNYREPGKK